MKTNSRRKMRNIHSRLQRQPNSTAQQMTGLSTIVNNKIENAEKRESIRRKSKC